MTDDEWLRSAAGAGAGPGELLTGRRLGPYRVGPVTATGPMSTLYKAYDVRLDRPVALKVISPLLAGDDEFRARFIEEARALSAVDHPHVVPLYDHDEDSEGHLWLTMRWIEGPTLAELSARGPLSLCRTLDLLDQVAQALDAVHARSLVHLDVKPANILVAPAEHSEGEHAYLVDFGLTRRGRAVSATASGEFIGSPAFAAPECLRGEPAERAADIYGLACSVHAALTGRPPYVGTVDEVIGGHLSGWYPAVSEVRAAQRVPSAPHFEAGGCLDRELRRAMAQRAGDRHATASEFSRAVRQAMIDDSARRDIQSRPATSVRRPTEPSVHLEVARRRRAPLASPVGTDVFFGPSSSPPYPVIVARTGLALLAAFLLFATVILIV